MEILFALGCHSSLTGFAFNFSLLSRIGLFRLFQTV